MQGQIPGAAAVQVQGGSPQAAALAAQQQQQQQSISVKMDPANQLSSAGKYCGDLDWNALASCCPFSRRFQFGVSLNVF